MSAGCPTTASIRSGRGRRQDRGAGEYPGGCCWPMASTTCRRAAWAKEQSSTPTRSARRSRSSECGCCRRWRRSRSTPRRLFDTMARWRRRQRGLGVRRGRRRVNWNDELAQLPSLLAEKARAPSVTPGPDRLVIDPPRADDSRIDRHAERTSRAIGYEPPMRAPRRHTRQARHHALRIAVMNVTRGPDSRIRFGQCGFRRRGGAGRRAGIWCRCIFVGYQLDRVFAPRWALARSNGCSYADFRTTCRSSGGQRVAEAGVDE